MCWWLKKMAWRRVCPTVRTPGVGLLSRPEMRNREVSMWLDSRKCAIGLDLRGAGSLCSIFEIIRRCSAQVSRVGSLSQAPFSYPSPPNVAEHNPFNPNMVSYFCCTPRLNFFDALLFLLISKPNQVGIGESTCGAKWFSGPLSDDCDECNSLFDISELSRVALERASTARYRQLRPRARGWLCLPAQVVSCL